MLKCYGCSIHANFHFSTCTRVYISSCYLAVNLFRFHLGKITSKFHLIEKKKEKRMRERGIDTSQRLDKDTRIYAKLIHRNNCYRPGFIEPITRIKPVKCYTFHLPVCEAILCVCAALFVFVLFRICPRINGFSLCKVNLNNVFL